MPVVIALGGDPASIYSGSAPLPPTIDEFIFAGFLRQRAGRARARRSRATSRCPAEAEIVLEGYIDPAEALVTGGSVRRPHRVLLAGRLLSPGARHRDHDAARPDLSRDDRRPAADGGLLPRPRHRADLPAAAQAHGARDRGLSHARRGDLPQPRLRLDRQAVSGAGVQGDERALGAGPDVARQGDRRRRQGRQRPQSGRGVVGGAQQHRSRARRAVHDGTDRRARSCEPGASPTAARWGSTRPGSGRKRDSRASGRS